MYNLGEYFKLDYTKAFSENKAIIKGNKYRITILSDMLIRLEYNESGNFENRLTELVWNRLFEVPKFEIKEDEKYLEIKTKYFSLNYLKESNFKGSSFNPAKNLKVDLLNSEKSWYYGKKEIRNLSAPGKYLENKNGKIEFSKGLFSEDGLVTIDDSDSKIISESGEIINRENKTIDIYLFTYLNNFEECLKNYFNLTGYPSLIPRYALGNWWSRNVVYDDASLKKVVDDFDYNEIPLSVLLLNQGWHKNEFDGKEVKSGFTFNNELLKQPDKAVAYLHQKGIRVGLNINPEEGIYPFEQYYENVKQYIQPDEKGVIPFDVLNPKFVDIYLKMLIHPLDTLDVDFYWLDSKLDSEKLFMLNHYHYFDSYRNYKKRPMLLTTNAEVASHRYPVLYSGKTKVSWDTLKLIPYHNSCAANVGVSFWSHDIGGYYKGTEDNELYIRFVQLGTFSPILKFGADKGKYYKREPWKWSVKTYTIAKDYLELRHKMIPYVYNESYKYHKEGIPLIKPVFYKNMEMFDDDLFKDSYFFGSQMFISPITNKKDYVMNRVIHKFFLPDGIWYDYVTGKKFPGGRQYVSFFKDQDYPVFAKAGAILPFGYNDNLNDTTPPKNMEISIFPGVSNKYDLYEDDGVSTLYKKGYFLKSTIEYNYLPNNYAIIVRAIEGKSGIVPEFRNYKFILRNTKEAKDVSVYFNNDPITFTKYVDGPNFIIEVKDVKSIGQLTINCKGKDIEIDAVRLINQDIEGIISDLELETKHKEKIDEIIFSELPLKKKRIELRKLSRIGLERKFIKLFLKLLEYIGQV